MVKRYYGNEHVLVKVFFGKKVKSLRETCTSRIEIC